MAKTGIARFTNEFRNLADPIAAYRGNPLIGALPPILSEEETYDHLTNLPAFSAQERTLPAHLRMHAVCALQELFIPGPQHASVLSQIDIMIRRGYAHRNPLSPANRRLVREDNELLKGGCLPPPERYSHIPLLGAGVFGTAGTGKTAATKRSLSRYPSVVDHLYEEDGVRFAFRQVPFVFVNMISDSSPKAFATTVLNAMSEIVGVDLQEKYNTAGCNGLTIIPKLYQALRDYHVGLIIVDEVQNMSSYTRGYGSVLSYFIRLMNSLGLPLLIVGTERARTLIKTDFAVERRFISGIRPFRPFADGDPLLSNFLEEIGSFCYLETVCDLQRLASTVHALTGGVPDLVIKLFMLAQTRLFGRETEVLTDEVLHQTAADLFGGIEKTLIRIRTQGADVDNTEETQRTLNERLQKLLEKESQRVGSAEEAKATAAKKKPCKKARRAARGKTPRHDDPLLAASTASDKIAALEKAGVLDLAE